MSNKKLFDKIYRFKKELSELYNVPLSSIVWTGNNNFIVVKDGKEIYVGTETK